MSDSSFSRRDLLRNIAISAALGGLSADAAQHVHHAAAEDKKAAGGVYKPKLFNAHEYATLKTLTEIILPGAAAKGGAPEFIDLLSSENPELAAIYTGGIAWLDREMQRRHGSDFLQAAPDKRTAMLDLIAYSRNDSPELGPGIHFFDWARKMTVDAYYTSKAGIEELGYKGNVGMAQFKVPAEALQYAMKKSGLG